MDQMHMLWHHYFVRVLKGVPLTGLSADPSCAARTRPQTDLTIILDLDETLIHTSRAVPSVQDYEYLTLYVSWATGRKSVGH